MQDKSQMTTINTGFGHNLLKQVLSLDTQNLRIVLKSIWSEIFALTAIKVFLDSSVLGESL